MQTIEIPCPVNLYKPQNYYLNIMKSPKRLDTLSKEFYDKLRKDKISISFARDEVQTEAERQLSPETQSLVFRATWCFEYDFAKSTETVVIYYSEDCRICRPDCLVELTEFCERLKLVGDCCSFRLRGSDGHWYVRWDSENDQWVKGMYIDG